MIFTTLQIVAIALLLCFAFAVYLRGVDGLPDAFKARACQGAAWKRAFPNVKKQHVRLFLSTFIEAFAFKKSHRLLFTPSDKIYDVYRAVYPKLGGVDALELETFAVLVEQRYGVRLEQHWSENLTLGDLFSVLAERHENVA